MAYHPSPETANRDRQSQNDRLVRHVDMVGLLMFLLWVADHLPRFW